MINAHPAYPAQRATQPEKQIWYAHRSSFIEGVGRRRRRRRAREDVHGGVPACSLSTHVTKLGILWKLSASLSAKKPGQSSACRKRSRGQNIWRAKYICGVRTFFMRASLNPCIRVYVNPCVHISPNLCIHEFVHTCTHSSMSVNPVNPCFSVKVVLSPSLS